MRGRHTLYSDPLSHPRNHCIIPILTAVGVSAGTAGTVAAGVTTAAALASTGVAIAGAAGAFDPNIPEGPEVPDDAAIAGRAEEARRRRAVALQGQVGRRQTLLSLGTGGAPQTARPTLLGGTAGSAAGF